MPKRPPTPSSYASAKNALIAALRTPSLRVMALSGPWGTGKTHLWQSIEKDATSVFLPKGKVAYVTAFGKKSIDEIKTSLTLALAKSKLVDGESRTYDVVKTLGNVVVGAAKLFDHRVTAGLDLLVATTFPKVAEGALIVIDDIERSHPGLTSEAIMGFASELSEVLNARVLLILNVDQLSDQLSWAKYRDKVIDREIVIAPTVTDAFAIAQQIVPSDYALSIGKAVETLGINNIRVLVRIIRFVNSICELTTPLDEATQAALVPDLTLLASLHYKALLSNPSLDRALGFSAFAYRAGKQARPPISDDEGDALDELFDKLSIYEMDELDACAADALRNGIIDTDAFVPLLSDMQGRVNANTARELLSELKNDVYWNHRVPKADERARIRALIPSLSYLEAGNAAVLASLATASGDVQLADEVADAWVATGAINRKKVGLGSVEALLRNVPFAHPTIVAAVRAEEHRQNVPLTLTDALESIMRHNGIAREVPAILAAATVADYETVIRAFDRDKFSVLIVEPFRWMAMPAEVQPDFTTAKDTFISAGKAIIAREPASKLAEIIRREFREHGIDV